MIYELCAGKGYIQVQAPELQTVCPVCNGKSKTKPPTEKEYLQSCNIEQLAETLCQIWNGNDDIINILVEDEKISKKEAMIKWLKQPHHNKVEK